MVCTTCENCGNKYHWGWSEAFAKFGFNDGDGNIETPLIARALENAGYHVKYSRWSPHNTLIYSINKEGIEYMPDKNSEHQIGYDNPNEYLTSNIIKLLDKAFPPTTNYYFDSCY